MKSLLFLVILTFFAVGALVVTGQDRAVFRFEEGHYKVEVIIKTKTDDSKPVIAALYSVEKGKRKQVSKFEGAVSSEGDTTIAVTLSVYGIAAAGEPAGGIAGGD